MNEKMREDGEAPEISVLAHAALFDLDPHRREAIRVKAKSILRKRPASSASLLESLTRIYTKVFEPAFAFTACVVYLIWSFSTVNAIYRPEVAHAATLDMPAEKARHRVFYGFRVVGEHEMAGVRNFDEAHLFALDARSEWAVHSADHELRTVRATIALEKRPRVRDRYRCAGRAVKGVVRNEVQRF